jgi:hypothetical protein
MFILFVNVLFWYFALSKMADVMSLCDCEHVKSDR